MSKSATPKLDALLAARGQVATPEVLALTAEEFIDRSSHNSPFGFTFSLTKRINGCVTYRVILDGETVGFAVRIASGSWQLLSAEKDTVLGHGPSRLEALLSVEG